MNGLFGSLSLALAIKGTLLLVGAFAMSIAFHKASASLRHAIWALAFAGLLVVAATGYLTTVREGLRIPVALLEPASADAPDARPAIDRKAAPERREVEPRAAAESRAPSLPGYHPAALLWLAGSLVLSLRLMVGLVLSSRVLREARSLTDPSWLDALEAARARLGIRSRVALLESDRVQLPMTVGLFRSAIVLPLAASAYSLPRRRAVLLHELAHVRRRDCASQLLGQLACAVFFWNPLVWIAARHMRLLSERASDDLVLDAGERASEYAHDLLEMAKSLHKERGTPLLSVAMAHRSRFEERLLAILDPRLSRRAVSSRFVLVAALVALPLAVSLALAVPTARTAVRAQAAAAPAPEQEPEPPAPVEEATPAAPVAAPRQTTAASPAAPAREARERARAALAQALDDPEASVREQALHALVSLGDSSVAPYLEKALSDAEPENRAQAAWGLGQLEHEESAGRLAELLRDSDAEVREQAAWALGNIRSASSVESLAGALSDTEESVREQAAWALGNIGRREAVDALTSALSDSSPGVREQAAWALGALGDPKAVEALTRALKDEDADVREQAAWALGVIAGGDEPDTGDPDPDPNPRPDEGASSGVERTNGAPVIWGKGALL
jgi:beta-lactamase regulating signal transducer with metallopeptidase domain